MDSGVVSSVVSGGNIQHGDNDSRHILHAHDCSNSRECGLWNIYVNTSILLVEIILSPTLI